MYPPVLQSLLPDQRERWLRNQAGGRTRRDLVLSAIDELLVRRRFERETELRALISQEFSSRSLDREQKLLSELKRRLDGVDERAMIERAKEWRSELDKALQAWLSTTIFDYTAFTKLMVEHWAAALRLKSADQGLDAVIDGVGEDIAVVVEEAFARGQTHLVSKGELVDARFGKARNGIVRFVDAIFAAAKEFANERGTADRRRISMLAAAAAWGVTDGFGRVQFQSEDGSLPVQALYEGLPHSRADLLRGLHLIAFHSQRCPAWIRAWMHSQGYEVTTIEGLWLAGVVCDRRSAAQWFPVALGASVRQSTAPVGFLEFDVEADNGQPNPFRFKTAVFLAPLSASAPIQEILSAEAGASRYSLILARQVDCNQPRFMSTLLTQVPALPVTAAEPGIQQMSEAVAGSLHAVIAGHSEVTIDDLKNYAIDFPLDEKARISGAYLVGRPSAVEYVRRVLQEPGLYLSCGMRRSGKTTAFQPQLIGQAGLPAGAVTVESCRANGYPLRFFDWIKKDVWKNQHAITAEDVVGWFESQMGDSRLLILDEYESLFHWMNEEVQRNPIAKLDFFDPLLDGFVEASDRWSVLFLGLNPRAARIFMQDNPVAPRLQSSPFPLFQHSANQGSTEFAELLGKVVTSNFEIEQILIDRLHYWTAGHPHFAVSVIREFIDWVLKNNRLREARDRKLRADWWDSFAADRLEPLAMMQSAHFAKYKEFHSAWRDNSHDSWLRAIARLAEHIGSELVDGKQAVDFVAAAAGVDPGAAREMLVDASQANFVSIEPSSGAISMMVPLYGRLAKGWQ